MNTIRVYWNQLAGEWLVMPFPGCENPLSLEQWAASQPERSQVRMLLASANYSTHYVELPGVSSRHLARALPFALEEHLIEDVSRYQIVAAGKHGSKVRAYAASTDLVERLLEQAEHLHLQVFELVPETWLLPESSSAIWFEQGWLLKISGEFEGWLPAAAMTPMLDTLLTDKQGIGEFHIQAPGIDQANLLKTTIETGYSGVFSDVVLHSGGDSLLPSVDQLTRPANLLSGQFAVRETRIDKPRVWWRPLAAMAASLAIIYAVGLGVENHQLKQQSAEAYQQARQLYGQLFPGSRIQYLERDFRSKLSEGANASTGGFGELVNLTAQAVAELKASNLKLGSMRFNERQGELILEVVATNLADVQSLREAIAAKGLKAEVASAANENNVVKGRIKVEGSV
ncbi:type II secretion system protein GspL [Oceanobacter mangrovi]|uniref:type II secretion system protein GspL n=1 Tax=Oceanobacter mangrovi TaxID=2862510 RepID=UPI001C8DF3E2|nr:type II secretion system protein GspL [Oceanobacter mangrovi]